MKLISSSPKTPLRPLRGWFWRRLRSRAFSARTAWWVLKSALEVGLQ